RRPNCRRREAAHAANFTQDQVNAASRRSQVINGPRPTFLSWTASQLTVKLNSMNFKAGFSLEDARRDLVQLRASSELDAMKLSKAAFAQRWHVPKSTRVDMASEV